MCLPKVKLMSGRSILVQYLLTLSQKILMSHALSSTRKQLSAPQKVEWSWQKDITEASVHIFKHRYPFHLSHSGAQYSL